MPALPPWLAHLRRAAEIASPAMPLGQLTDLESFRPLGLTAGTVGRAALVSVLWHLAVAAVATLAAVWALRRPVAAARRKPRRRGGASWWQRGVLRSNPLLYRALVLDVLDPDGRLRRMQVLWILLLGAAAGLAWWWDIGHTSRMLLAVAAWLQFGTHLFVAVLGASSVARERRRGGLDALRLTCLGDTRLALGALAATLLAVRPSLLALAGVCVAPGVHDPAFAAAYPLLGLSLTLFFAAAAVLLSTVHPETGTATVLAVALVPGYRVGMLLWPLTLPLTAAVVVPAAASVLLVRPAGRLRLCRTLALGSAVFLAPVGALAWLGITGDGFWDDIGVRRWWVMACLGAAVYLAVLAPAAGLGLWLAGRNAGTPAAVWLAALLPALPAGALHLADLLDPQVLAGARRPAAVEYAEQASPLHWTCVGARPRGSSDAAPLGWSHPCRVNNWHWSLHGVSRSWGLLAATVYGGSGLALAAMTCLAFGRHVGRDAEDP